MEENASFSHQINRLKRKETKREKTVTNDGDPHQWLDGGPRPRLGGGQAIEVQWFGSDAKIY